MPVPFWRMAYTRKEAVSLNEFLIPAPYTGPGAGIGVMFAGLTGPYQKLEITVDGKSVEVHQDPDDPFCSEPHEFSGLVIGTLYQVQGRAATENGAEETSCMIPAATAQPKVRFRSLPMYRGGGASTPPAPPEKRFE